MGDRKTKSGGGIQKRLTPDMIESKEGWDTKRAIVMQLPLGMFF